MKRFFRWLRRKPETPKVVIVESELARLIVWSKTEGKLYWDFEDEPFMGYGGDVFIDKARVQAECLATEIFRRGFFCGKNARYPISDIEKFKILVWHRYTPETQLSK